MKPLLLAGHPALEFLNTTMSPGGTTIELIEDGRALLDWLVAAGLLEPPAAAHWRRRFDAAALDDVAAEARKLRTWAAGWLTRWREGGAGPSDAELARLNAALARGNAYRQLIHGDGELALVDRHRGQAADELLGILALHLAELVRQEQPALVKRCDGAACTLWFLDRTKAHRRRFCSVTACGNRDKVAAFRARQRGAGRGGPGR